MKHLLIFFTLLLFCLPLSGCAKPLRERTPLELDMMPNEDLCNIAYLTNEEVLAEKIANIKGSSCDPAKAMCYEAGLTPKSKKWSECFIQAKGVLAQQEVASAARASARAANAAADAAHQANMQSMMPKTCYGYGNAVTCY